ncbi:MAG: oxygen-independent coproporphyrinogen III oxidase [Lachnospiraceae bacterium]|nr:oxygen-independent coproporphyrinogen III oxidase [Lachnospiraceae bacterium]
MKNEISVYVHLPFCVKKCNYCDFLSGSFDDGIKRAYLKRLLLEIDHYGALLSGRMIRSVYLGGGTPSLLDPSFIRSIMKKLTDITMLKSGCEITIEMNPGTADERKIGSYRECGINRFSIGLQSVNDDELASLGRIHTYGDFLYLYDLLRKNGASNINVDLMTGIPHESMSSAERTLETVCALKPEHISVYSLIIEDGTPFSQAEKKNLDLPDEDEEYAIYEMTRRILSGHGYERYEISNYAKRGFECRHNITYWDLDDYIGFGAGASSRLGERRFTNIKSVEGYIGSDDPVFDEDICLDERESMSEFMFLGLRKTAGISRSDFARRFGKDPSVFFGSIIERYEGEGLLKMTKDRLAFTERGLDVSNIVLSEFV